MGPLPYTGEVYSAHEPGPLLLTVFQYRDRGMGPWPASNHFGENRSGMRSKTFSAYPFTSLGSPTLE